MEMSNIFIILLIVIPGMIQNFILEFFDGIEKEEGHEIKYIYESIAQGIPVTIASIWVYSKIKNIKNINDLLIDFKIVNNIVLLIILLSITSIIFVIIKYFSREKLYDKFNNCCGKGRGSINKKSYQNNWKKYIDSHKFDNEGNALARFIKATIDGREYKGFVKEFSTTEDGAVILDMDIDYLECNDFDMNKLFENVIEIYCNPSASIVIEEYDTSCFYEWIESKKTKNL